MIEHHTSVSSNISFCFQMTILYVFLLLFLLFCKFSFLFSRIYSLAGSHFPDQRGIEPRAQPWKPRILTTRSPGNSPTCSLILCLSITPKRHFKTFFLNHSSLLMALSHFHFCVSTLKSLQLHLLAPCFLLSLSHLVFNTTLISNS